MEFLYQKLVKAFGMAKKPEEEDEDDDKVTMKQYTLFFYKNQ